MKIVTTTQQCWLDLGENRIAVLEESPLFWRILKFLI